MNEKMRKESKEYWDKKYALADKENQESIVKTIILIPIVFIILSSAGLFCIALFLKIFGWVVE